MNDIPAPHIRQRNSALPSTPPVPSGLSSFNESIEDFKPEYVLKVLYLTDPATLKPTNDAEMDFVRLIKTLDFNGFKVLIKPDSYDRLLVFVKLIPSQLEKLSNQAKREDFVYGICDNESSELSNADKARIIYSYITGDKSQGGCNITVGQGNWSFVEALMPLVSYKEITKESSLFKSKLASGFSSSTALEQVNFLLKNFGSKYAFYFKFLSYYLKWLVASSALGVAANYLLGRYSKIYTILNSLMSIAFYLQWISNEQSLSSKWGSSRTDNIDNYIPGVTKEDPSWIILAREALFTPIALGYGAVLVSVQFLCFIIEIFLTEIYDGPFKSVVALVPTILLSVATPIIMTIYSIVAKKYIAIENHSHFSTQSRSMTVKLFVLNFLASYMALYITSFVYLPFGFKLNPYLPNIEKSVEYITGFSYYIPAIPIKSNAYKVNQLRLNNQYNFFVVTSQVIGLCTEFVLPLVLAKIFKKKQTPVSIDDSPEDKEILQDIRASLSKAEFDIDSEYRQLVIQFGYLTLFGSVWPLGAVPCLLTDLIQFKFDYLKLTKLAKTTIPARSSSIKPFNSFIKFLVILGSFTSMSISLMYNGGEIISSPESSSNQLDMSLVLLLSVVAGLVTWSLISIGEAIIAEYFQSFAEQKNVQLKQKVVSSEENSGDFNEKSKRSDGVYNPSEIDDILKFASTIPKSIAVKKEDK